MLTLALTAPIVSAQIAKAPVPAPTPSSDVIYRMQPGDSPWSISESYLAGMQFWPRIVRRNDFTASATRLPPGTLVRIPQAWLRRRDVPATVLAVADAVFITAPDGSRRVVTAGMLLQAGERLTTSDTASATLELHDGSRVLVRPATDFELTASNRPVGFPVDSSNPTPAVDPDGSSLEVRLRLLRGAIENVVQPLNPAGRFEIDTPSAVAAVRGTVLRVALQDQSTHTELPEGGLLLQTDGAALRLAAGEGTRTEFGQRPEPATPLLPAPDLTLIPDVIMRLPIELPLPLVAGALGYRAQLLLAVPPPTLVSDEFSSGPRLRAREPVRGDYLLRVRGVDARGLEGFTAERTVRVHVRPTPPLMIAPQPDARLADEQPVFRWSQAALAGGGPANTARSVRLQVAAAADFTTPVSDQTLGDEGQAQIDAPLAPGDLYWRLQAIDPVLGPGPWSDPQRFQRILPAPGVAPPDIDSNGLTLRWPSVPGAVRYHVQIARDSEFADLVEERLLETDRVRLERPAEGTYFLRMQAITADGVPGAFSEPEQFRVDQPINLWNLLWLLAPLVLAL